MLEEESEQHRHARYDRERLWAGVAQSESACHGIKSNYADANHHPIAVVNGDASRQVLQVSAAAGSNVALAAAGSSDPDGNALLYAWSFFAAASSYTGTVAIQNSSAASATVAIPAGASGKTIHTILELRDDGAPNLYAYRRVIIQVQ